jgi:hypothetical protein
MRALLKFVNKNIICLELNMMSLRCFPMSIAMTCVSRLNLIVKELNSLNVSNLDKGMINRKILMLLPKPKYNIINSILQKEDLDEIKVVELVGEIRAHEMSVLGISEEATPSKSIALKAKTKKKSKLKMIKHESSSSE